MNFNWKCMYPLVLSGKIFPFLSHVICGVGVPTRGSSILIGSPALTFISLMPPIIPLLSNFGFSILVNL